MVLVFLIVQINHFCCIISKPYIPVERTEWAFSFLLLFFPHTNLWALPSSLPLSFLPFSHLPFPSFLLLTQIWPLCWDKHSQEFSKLCHVFKIYIYYVSVCILYIYVFYTCNIHARCNLVTISISVYIIL